MVHGKDWTMDQGTGRSNSSQEFGQLIEVVDRIIRSSGSSLVSGQVESAARVIMAQLAHEHGLRPASSSTDKDWTVLAGHANSSDHFVKMVSVVEALIRNGAHDIISGNSSTVARVIMAQLAHEHGLAPVKFFVKRWAVEFRNGGFLQSLEADNSGPVETAQTFATKAATEDFMRKHEWTYFNGGMAKEVEVLQQD